MAKIEGVTTGGFQFSIDDAVKNDMEMVDMLAELDEGNGLALSKVCLKLLGKEQRKKLYAYLRNTDGIVPVEAVGETIKDIFSAMGTEGKN